MAASSEGFSIPPGNVVATVKIIDTHARIRNSSVSYLMGPPLQGFDKMPVHPSLSFLIEHPSGQRVLFDLSISKDWRNYSPVVQALIEHHKWVLDVPSSVAEILEEHGVSLDSISHIVWRYMET